MAGRKSGAVEWLTKDGLTMLESYARDGLTDKQIAESKLGISERTFTTWKEKYPAIVSALKKGKAPVDVQVENMLLRSAMGFTKTIREAVKLRQRGGTEIIEYVDKEIYIAPNITAQIFWLKNRKRDKWCDKPEPIKKTEQIEDGFIKALEGKATEVWEDYEDEAE
jgi:hypothetical protein